MVQEHYINRLKLAIALMIMLQLAVLNANRHINDRNDNSHHHLIAIPNADNNIDLVEQDQLQ